MKRFHVVDLELFFSATIGTIWMRRDKLLTQCGPLTGAFRARCDELLDFSGRRVVRARSAVIDRLVQRQADDRDGNAKKYPVSIHSPVQSVWYCASCFP